MNQIFYNTKDFVEVGNHLTEIGFEELESVCNDENETTAIIVNSDDKTFFLVDEPSLEDYKLYQEEQANKIHPITIREIKSWIL